MKSCDLFQNHFPKFAFLGCKGIHDTICLIFAPAPISSFSIVFAEMLLKKKCEIQQPGLDLHSVYLFNHRAKRVPSAYHPPAYQPHVPLESLGPGPGPGPAPQWMFCQVGLSDGTRMAHRWHAVDTEMRVFFDI